MVRYKICHRCKKNKPETEYTVRNYGGLYYLCNPCKKLKKAENNEKRKIAYGVTYTGKIRQARITSALFIFEKCRANSIRRPYKFLLNPEDIVIPKVCPILGIPIITHLEFKGKGINWNAPSIDRLENDKDYTKDNIVVCSWKANNLKRELTFEQIKAWYLFLKKHLKK